MPINCNICGKPVTLVPSAAKRTKKPTLDELACQYLDSTISLDQSIQILQEMNNSFGAIATNQKVNEFRKIYALVGIKG